MSLANRGLRQASLVAPGAFLHSFYLGITNEWRPDFIEGISRLDISENDLMTEELSQVNSILTTNNNDWISPHGFLTPSCSEALLDSCSMVLNELFKPYKPIQTHQLVVGSGCSLLLEAVACVICNENEVILTPGPVWPVFQVILGQAKVSLSVVPPSIINREKSISSDAAMKELETLLCWTEETEQVWAQHIGQLFQDRKVPRAILLSNPQNPLGRCYLQSFLVRTLEFCEKHNLFLISDEVFVLSGHRTGEFEGHAGEVHKSVVNIILTFPSRHRFNSEVSIYTVNQSIEAKCDLA
ncbi:pyridoxal phosphate-dependent transferase [Gymnopilus junonius]|uniref:Pyridoxal phosphate-dependent transferase n=1 Tax=Gymnopilus junonius TaxID=109634 RepID=A0A9P5TFH9_GYMJU|nr:pyridoxal phosphate-dependent transferase [Gymnopilus junonius]